VPRRGQSATLSEVIEPPETRYAKAADGTHIAYQVFGDGPPDIVAVPDWFTNLEAAWENPYIEAFLGGLGRIGRVVVYDQRGSGLSDPIALSTLPSLEHFVDDLRFVLDAAGVEHAALFGADSSGPVCLLFAATHPDRASALILLNTMARPLWAPDHPIGISAERAEETLAWITEHWGTGKFGRLLSPSWPEDEAAQAQLARDERRSASPGAAAAFMRMAFEIDVRAALPAVQAPTLVLHRVGDRWVRAAHGRHLAEQIAGATYVELPGADHLPSAGDTEAVLGEVAEFLTGVRPVPESDRVLVTVLLTDIVASTERQAEVGDQRWKQLLTRHDEAVRRQIQRFGGREVKTTGDGVLSTFDGPARAARCAIAAREAARQLGLETRAGLHTGEVELRGADIAGVAVHIAARIAALAHPGEVLVSRTVRDLVAGSGIAFSQRGTHVLRGVPDEWQLFAVTSE
jgi:class 3 adenylate cyclase